MNHPTVYSQTCEQSTRLCTHCEANTAPCSMWKPWWFVTCVAQLPMGTFHYTILLAPNSLSGSTYVISVKIGLFQKLRYADWGQSPTWTPLGVQQAPPCPHLTACEYFSTNISNIYEIFASHVAILKPPRIADAKTPLKSQDKLRPIVSWYCLVQVLRKQGLSVTFFHMKKTFHIHGQF